MKPSTCCVLVGLAVLLPVVVQAGDMDRLAQTGSWLYVDAGITPASCDDYDPSTRACGSGSAPGYRTIAGATAAAGPGDSVLLREGTYREALRVERSGEPGKPVTFRGFDDERAIITGDSLSPAVEISGRSYVVLERLEVTDVRRWLYAVDAHHNVIRDNVFRHALDPGHSQKAGLFFQEATYNRIKGNLIEDCSEDNLYLVKSDYNVVEGNTFRKAYHTLWAIKCGNFNVMRGNYFHNEDQKIGEIYDCHDVGFDREFYLYDATKHNLVEGNEFAYVPSSGNRSPYSGIQYAGQSGIIRRNRFHSTVGPGLSMTLYPDEARHNTDNRVYHNVFHDTDFAGISISPSQAYAFRGNVFKNNVLTGSRFVANDTRWSWYTDELDGTPVQLLTGRLDGILFDSNNLYHATVDEPYVIAYGSRTSSNNPPPQPVSWWDAHHPDVFTRTLQADPGFRDGDSHDFRLAPNSPMIDAATFLTSALGDGSGDVLPVEDATYFFDGFGIPGEVGDQVQLEGEGESSVVVKTDFANHTLTLSRAITWSDGQGVALAYNGVRPDVGAFEFEPVPGPSATVTRTPTATGTAAPTPTPTHDHRFTALLPFALASALADQTQPWAQTLDSKERK